MMAAITTLGRSSSKAAVAETFNGKIMPNCDEMFICGQDADGRLVWDAFGMRRADLLWALEKCKHELLFGPR